ncbi:MAG: SgcJ/EcaC family oxidoreductase [Gemmatimonadota bacterium]
MPDDREEIERLHERDMRASKARHYATLRTLMSDDAVVLPPGGRAIRGRSQIDAGFAKMGSVEPDADVLEYRFEWEEVRILGDYAYEWGYIHGRERDRKTGAETTSAYHVMRILQRQADGSWKVHRTIWNDCAVPRGSQ